MKISQSPQPAGVHHVCVARAPPTDLSLIILCPQGLLHSAKIITCFAAARRLEVPWGAILSLNSDR
eukprot:1166087-Prymnesium_polylepis.1